MIEIAALSQRFGLWLVLYVSSTLTVGAQTVEVQHHGAINLSEMRCEFVTRSSFVRRVCFDPGTSSMVLDLSGRHYKFCGVDGNVVENFKAALSMGRHFNEHIKGRFNC